MNNTTQKARKRAPGKHWRKGLTLVELIRKFPDDKTAEAWIASIRWPDGPRCPHCDHDNIQHPTAHKTMPYRCRRNGCRKFFSVKVGTVMQNSKLGYQEWAIAVYLFNTSLKGVSSMKLHRDLGISQKSAWHLAHRIRQCWNDLNGEPFEGPVEADETYVNGQAHVNGVESFWAGLKRGYHGTHHHMSAKHLDRYVAEFCGRHNRRPLDTEDMMAASVRGMVGKRLTYTTLTAEPHDVAAEPW